MTVVCTENLNSYVMVMKSYWQVQPKFDTSHARSLYNDHFGPVEGPLIYDTVATYFKDSLRLTMWAALASGIVFFVCATRLLPAPSDLLLIVVVSLFIVGRLFLDDSNSRLKEWFSLSNTKGR